MSAITDRILDAWENHQRPRLHSGMVNKEPVLATEYPKAPKFLILCPNNWDKLRRDIAVDYMQLMVSQRFIEMRISILMGRHEDIPDTVEVR